jgi:tRNA pseudouridine55 synthase
VSQPQEPAAGIVVVDKPAGWTSHQVVGRIRRLAGTRKVGHAGTLDPMATGVLVIGIGQATRLLGHLALGDKSYTATIRLGASTITDDAEGEMVAAPGAADLGEEQIRAAIAGLRGAIEQVPSAVSAIKVGGVRSYARVRAGSAVELPPRPVRVDRFDVGSISRQPVDGRPMIDLEVEVDCSSGTYVRALARDLGAALGCGGHLTALRRTRVGPFTLAEVLPTLEPGTPVEPIDLPTVAQRCFPVANLDARQTAAVRHGRPLPDLALTADPTALLGPDGSFLALYRPGPAGAVAAAVFAAG